MLLFVHDMSTVALLRYQGLPGTRYVYKDTQYKTCGYFTESHENMM